VKSASSPLTRHLFAQDRADVLTAMNEAVSRLHAYEDPASGNEAESQVA
jgi:hypothetical protein